MRGDIYEADWKKNFDSDVMFVDGSKQFGYMHRQK